MIEILQFGNNKIQKLISKQEIDIKQYEYIDSPYIIKVYFLNDIIIENILTGEIISQRFPLEKKDDNFLIEHWFKIPKNFNIYLLYKKIQDSLSLFSTNYNNYSLLENFSKLTIFTTLGCNAHCHYCYEKQHLNNNLQMTEKTANKIIKMLVEKNKKEVEICWFGGEPLFNEKIIDYICDQLILNNINYKSSMISNGLLFNENNIKKAIQKWHLTHVQITIDGIENEYEQIKQVKKGSFQLLLKNIENLLKAKISINVRLNLGMNNFFSLKKLIVLLSKKFSSYENFHINIHELFGIEKEKNIYNNLLKLELYIESLFKNFKFKKYQWSQHGCTVDNDSRLTILPDGKIGLCEHSIFLDYFSDLDNNFYIIENINKYTKYSDKKECQSCPIRPGCIFNAACEANGGQNCNINRVNYIKYVKKKRLIQLAKELRKRREHLMIIRNLYTNLDIYNKATALIEAFNTQDGSDLNYPVKVNFYLQKNMNNIVNLAKEIEQKRIEIIQKYGTKKEDSEDYIIPEENIEEATKEIKDFFDLEQEVPINMLKLNWFDNIDMNAAQVAAISFMIEEEE